VAKAAQNTLCFVALRVAALRVVADSLGLKTRRISRRKYHKVGGFKKIGRKRLIFPDFFLLAKQDFWMDLLWLKMLKRLMK